MKGRSAKSRELPACPQGTGCPYISEYQHSSEFSHNHPPARPSQPSFVGSGAKLGGSKHVPRLLVDRYEEVEQMRKQRRLDQGAGHRGRGAVQFEDIDDMRPLAYNDMPLPPPMRTLSTEDSVVCGICKASVNLAELDAHMSRHDRQQSSKHLKTAQDAEYEESVLQEVLRATQADDASRAAEDSALQEEIRAATLESIRLQHIADKESALAHLLAEPDASYGAVVSIRFTLPSGKKIARRFRADHCVQECFDYLRSVDELCGLRVMLKEVVGGRSFRGPFAPSATFIVEGMRTSCSLVVVVLDEEDIAPSPKPAKVAVTPLRRKRSADVVDLTRT